jgi:L-iditol 2-dehydrogenase
MKAALLSPEGRVEVVDTPVPALEEGDILVEMKACGLCGSDLEKLSGEYTAAPPVIGHEAVGVVAEVGDGVEGLEKGDRVFPHHHVPCNECAYCTRGSPTMCPEYRRHHLDPGGFAECFRVPAWNVRGRGVVPLPDGMSFEVASFIEPLACCLRALDRVGVRSGDSVFIAGAGPMGLLLLHLLPQYRAGTAMVSEPSSVRRAFAEERGADAVFDPRVDDVSAGVLGMTEGRGADVTLVASGSPAALAQGLKAVRRGGTVGLVGIPESGASVRDASALVTREVSVISSNAATEDETERAVNMLASGAVEVSSLVTHRVPLEDFPRAVEVALSAEAVKVLVVPD